MPVTSFAAEFLELYRRAAQEEIRVTLTTPAAARRLRARLHSLRVALREEKHVLRTIAEGVQISIEDAVLVAKPSDDNFIEALQAAGIVIGEPISLDIDFSNPSTDAVEASSRPANPPAVPAAPAAPSPDSALENILRDEEKP